MATVEVEQSQSVLCMGNRQGELEMDTSIARNILNELESITMALRVIAEGGIFISMCLVGLTGTFVEWSKKK